jgi:uncharacterized membrane protein (DUF4010 family)
MPTDTVEVLKRLGVALAIGLLIGMERGWERRALPEGSRAAGFRTFGLISLLGALVPTLGWGPVRVVMLAVVGLIVGAALVVGYWRESGREADVSITTTITGLIAYSLGATAGSGAPVPAVATAVVVTVLLGFKPELHALLNLIDRAELLATLRLLLISIVLLPILPDRGLGPWQAVNPYRIWLMVVLVAGISYVGYFASRIFGDRLGVLLTGFFGGLASSTAVALEFSRREESKPEEINLIAAGILTACAIMFPRILLVLSISRSDMERVMLPTFGAAGIAGLIAAGIIAWRGYGRVIAATQIEHENPLDLSTALKFGLTIVILMVVARAAQARLGNQGLYIFAAVDGLFDVDALSLSVASMVPAGKITPAVAASAILIVAIVNTIVKFVIVATVAGKPLAIRVGLGMMGMLLAGGLVFWRVYVF